MSFLLSQAAELLYSVNPSLLKIPPRAEPEEYCYLGPDGGLEGALKCKDILYSHATCVGSWMLSPEHHIVEGIIVTILATLILRRIVPQLNNHVCRDTIQIQHPPGARIASLVCFGLMMTYKYLGYPGRAWYFVMPCNMQWVLSFLQCIVIPESWTLFHYAVLQMRLSYIMSVIIAIVTPETDDCILPGEYAFYWINHIILLVLPFAYVANGSVTCFPPQSTALTSTSTSTSTWNFNVLWWTYSCAAMAGFYFIPVTFLAIYSGLNLNFMLHPPHDHFALQGQWYRLTAILALAVLFAISRWMAYAFEKAVLVSKTDEITKEKKA